MGLVEKAYCFIQCSLVVNQSNSLGADHIDKDGLHSLVIGGNLASQSFHPNRSTMLSLLAGSFK